MNNNINTENSLRNDHFQAIEFKGEKELAGIAGNSGRADIIRTLVKRIEIKNEDVNVVFRVKELPGLDGGHLLYFAIEKIRGKPISVALEALLIRLGIIILFLLMVQVTINDLMRLTS